MHQRDTNIHSEEAQMRRFEALRIACRGSSPGQTMDGTGPGREIRARFARNPHPYPTCDEKRYDIPTNRQ